MSELIRREDAIKATWHEPSYSNPYNVLTEVRDRIKSLKPVDAVEIVRCGECKYNNRGFCDDALGCGVDDNWFCACGEREVQE